MCVPLPKLETLKALSKVFAKNAVTVHDTGIDGGLTGQFWPGLEANEVITGDQIIAHFVGDYILQSDWMVQHKSRKLSAAFIHVLFYSLPFLFLTTEPLALAIIAGTHMVIDRWRLARYLIWIKNYPWPGRRPWSECKETGFPPEIPKYLSSWLLIIVDNIIHILINGVALSYLG